MTQPSKVTRKELTNGLLRCFALIRENERPHDLKRLVARLERFNTREQRRRGRTPRPTCAQAARQREFFRKIHDRGWTIQDIAVHFHKVRGQPYTTSPNWKWTAAWADGSRGLNLAEFNILKQRFLNRGKPGVITVWRIAGLDRRFFTRAAVGREVRRMGGNVTRTKEPADLLTEGDKK